MNTAYSIHSVLLQTFRSFVHWLSLHKTSAPTPAAQATTSSPLSAINRIANGSASTAGSVAAKPLRVVRILESGQARTSVGRMVISGRMSDVCAELDRLVACEAGYAS